LIRGLNRAPKLRRRRFAETHLSLDAQVKPAHDAGRRQPGDRQSRRHRILLGRQRSAVIAVALISGAICGRTPLPPRFARSPSPAENAGEDEDVASLDLATAANLAAK
jgi:hypothetical protein